MEDSLIAILESFGFPVYRQGSLTPDTPYPDNFFTFWNSESPDHSYYDNDSYGIDWSYGVYFYSNDPAKTYDIITRARIELKKNKWIVPTNGFDVPSDVPTHTGRGLEVYFMQFN